jgi:hypothetical protein
LSIGCQNRLQLHFLIIHFVSTISSISNAGSYTRLFAPTPPLDHEEARPALNQRVDRRPLPIAECRGIVGDRPSKDSESLCPHKRKDTEDPTAAHGQAKTTRSA